MLALTLSMFRSIVVRPTIKSLDGTVKSSMPLRLRALSRE